MRCDTVVIVKSDSIHEMRIFNVSRNAIVMANSPDCASFFFVDSCMTVYHASIRAAETVPRSHPTSILRTSSCQAARNVSAR